MQDEKNTQPKINSTQYIFNLTARDTWSRTTKQAGNYSARRRPHAQALTQVELHVESVP